MPQPDFKLVSREFHCPPWVALSCRRKWDAGAITHAGTRDDLNSPGCPSPLEQQAGEALDIINYYLWAVANPPASGARAAQLELAALRENAFAAAAMLQRIDQAITHLAATAAYDRAVNAKAVAIPRVA